jgi:hypothetical protein
MSDASTSIDDLLRHDEEPPPTQEREISGLGWWVRTAFVAAGLAAVAVFGLRLFGYGLSIPLAFATFMALLVLRRAVALVAPPAIKVYASRPAGEEDGNYNWAAAGDGLSAAVRRWENRLAWADREPDRFVRSPQPKLAQIVDERLRQRHGFTATSDPKRARALLGDPLWTLLTKPPKRTPHPRDLTAIVSHLEKL